MTILANAVVWLLVVLGILAWRRPFTSTVAGTTTLAVPPMPVLVLLALIAAAGVASRVATGILVPADFVQEVVAYRSWVDSGSLYPTNFGSEFRKWLNVEQPAILSNLPPQVQEWRERQLDQIVPLYVVQAHPPPLVIATFPLLAVLGSYGAFLAFSIAGIVAVGWTASRLAAALRLAKTTGGTLLFLVIFLGWQPILANLRLGQPGLIIAALVVGGYLALRAGRDGLCGVLVVLAASLKLFPALLIVPIAVRRPRALLAALATLLGVLIATTLTAGGQSWVEYASAARTWSDVFGGAPNNFSLRSVLIGTLGRPGNWMFALIAIGMTAATLARVKGRGREDVAMAYAAFSCLALLLSPTCWSFYFVIALVPLGFLLHAAVRSGRRRDFAVWVALALALSLPDQPTWTLLRYLEPIVGAVAARLIASFPTWALLIAWWRLLRAWQCERWSREDWLDTKSSQG